ncbi:hypothetical protein QR680_004595 [Steinernema hermaphroditum]|uniref:Hsp90 chaperone protein kinase-targeting subunit n=1 Tax=Steinernema hermaphroditum TaxID=289476 RepID=A0AA39HP77_9BILA|nr:hypothetical protein QR680_004595 [Steinernema hermaphroditum]
MILFDYATEETVVLVIAFLRENRQACAGKDVALLFDDPIKPEKRREILDKMPIDYSKWKAIEVSDDEDDTHPNIDTPSLFRWRHQARLERMAERKQEKDAIEQGKKKAQISLGEIESMLADANLDTKERISLELKKQDMKKQEEEWLQKEQEIADKERLEPWNVDTIGQEKFSQSRINKIAEKKPESSKMTEEEESKRMADYFKKHEVELKGYGALHGFEASKKYLIEHPFLCSEFAASFLTIECLNLAIEEKDEEAGNMAEQCIIIQYLLEMARSLNALATNTTVINTFFKKIGLADPSYMKMFHDEVAAFKDRIMKRAVQKRQEYYSQQEEKDRQERIENSPGGVDPQEVYDSLPVEMRDAFDSREITKLQEVANKMDREVFSYHLQRCIDSGLWIPDANAAQENETEAES